MGQTRARVLAGLVTVAGAGVLMSLYLSAGTLRSPGYHPLRAQKCHACTRLSASASRPVLSSVWNESWHKETGQSQSMLEGRHPVQSCSGRSKTSAAARNQHGFFGPYNYITQSKNPCWYDTTDRSHTQLLCLPYFFLAGVSKCGSTDIFSRLSEHPQILRPREKEPRWFDIRRFAKESFTFKWYVSNFEAAATTISGDLKSYGFSRRIVGDGSPTYFWRNYNWPEYEENEGCSEPRVLNSDFIYHLVPHAKFIISFRNPVDSLYSKYLSYGDKGRARSPTHFHSLVTRQLQRYKECFARHSVRSCAYNITMSKGTEVRLEKGLYAIFLADWFRLFPRQQFHIIRFEDYISDVQGHLTNMFDFLQLDTMLESSVQELSSHPPANKGNHYHTGLMLPETRQLLQEFYAPFNQQLASLLSDERFLWPP